METGADLMGPVPGDAPEIQAAWAAAHLVAVVLDEQGALKEVLDQLLVGDERVAIDWQARAYFRDLATSVRRVLEAAADLERVADAEVRP